MLGLKLSNGTIVDATFTAANVHDSQELPNLMHGGQTRVYGDSAHVGQKAAMRERSPKTKDFTNQRRYRNCDLTEEQRMSNPRKSAVRAHVEHPFLCVKLIWVFAKTRYRGLAKNANGVAR